MRFGETTSQPPPADPPSPDSTQHRPKDLSILQSYINLIEIKYCEDTRPQNQLSPAQKQHKSLCNIRLGVGIRGASVTLHNILLGVGGSIYNKHMVVSFKERGFGSQKAAKLASKLHLHPAPRWSII